MESIRNAKQIARDVADGVRDQLWSERSAAAARERGSSDPYEINSYFVGVPGNLFPMLALVSDELRRRVDGVRKRQREHLHRNRLLTETVVPLGAWVDPAPPDIVDAIAARYAEEDATWENGLVALEHELKAADWRGSR